MIVWLLKFFLVSICFSFIGFYEPKKNDVSAIQISKYIICWNENVGMKMGKQCKWPNKTSKTSRLIFSFSSFGNGLYKGRNLQSLKIHCEVVYGYRPCTQNVF